MAEGPGHEAEIDVAALERRLHGAVRRARLAMFWERFWPAIAPLVGVLACFLVVSWLGLWLAVGTVAKLALLAVFAIAALGALVPLFRLRVPSEAQAIRRIETASALAHRPLSALADRLSGDDPGMQALWAAHRRRLAARLGRLKTGTPSPRLDRRDPYALRVGLALILLVAFVYAGSDRGRRVMAAFEASPGALAETARFDAWVTPPAYTDRPPIFLTRPGFAYDQDLRVPQGSEFVARMDGAETVILEQLNEDGVAEPIAPAEARAGASFVEFKHRLDASATLRITADGAAAGEWRFAITPDRPPSIGFLGEPERALSGAIRLAYSVEDDYGVTAAEARFAPANEASGAATGPEPRPLYEAPDFRLSLPGRGARQGEAETMQDLTQHPWAGAETILTLAARDDADQWGFSEPHRLTLPIRAFREPLARAVVEQRRNLAFDANASEVVALALETLTLDPAGRIEDSSVYLGLRSAYWRLVGARDDDTLRSVVDQLWQVALAIEDGDLSLAAQQLRAAQEALRQALQDGATDAELERLMQELRQAMAAFMQEMMAEAMRNPQQSMPQAGAQTLRMQDLERMMDQIENLARSGSRDAARELLAEMQNMMENLQAGRMGQPGESPMSEAMNELGEMIREQQRLMNETFRQQGQQGEPGQDMQDLQQGQSALRQQLQEMLDQLGQQGMQEGPLGEAGEAMGEAEQSLGQGNPGSAVDQQGRALEQLRQGAQAMAEQMQPGPGEAGMGPGGQQGYADEDPLGRPRRTDGPDFGTTVRVPDQIDVQRAREILEELRRRLSDPDRPRIELDYLERLLEQF